jgi:hypothetical protein
MFNIAQPHRCRANKANRRGLEHFHRLQQIPVIDMAPLAVPDPLVRPDRSSGQIPTSVVSVINKELSSSKM